MTGRGLIVAEVVTEVGSGLNARRPKLARLLRDPAVSAIVVEQRSRLGQHAGLSRVIADNDALSNQTVAQSLPFHWELYAA